MKRLSSFLVALLPLLAIVFLANNCSDPAPEQAEESQPTPELEVAENNGAFQNYRDSFPTKEQYAGPLFTLSHDYPTTVKPVVNPTWQQALKGQPISSANTFAYLDALKTYVAPNVTPFFTDNENWTSAKYGWFNEPWLGSQREAIMGSYLGNGNPANMFESLKVDEAGYAVVLYDSTAAYTLGKVWGETGQKVNLVDDAAQYAEGSVIVKLAFSNINAPEWPVMAGAQTFSIYDTIATNENPAKGYQVRKVSFFQMDIIVKDSQTSPKTGWVFSTFVYDMNAPGTFWDKMVPLGAMWGDDPDVKSPVSPPYPPLAETVINPNAPPYSVETLGWGGRLSGPNDGAVLQNITDVDGITYDRLAVSSCMSCHSPAQDSMVAFLLPIDNKKGFKAYKPGGEMWSMWFRDDYGNVPFSPGQVAMDYDMATAFKSIPAYYAATEASSKRHELLLANIEAIKKFRQNNARSQFWH